MANSVWFQRVGNGLIEYLDDKSTVFHPLLNNDKYLSVAQAPNRNSGTTTNSPAADDSSSVDGGVTADMVSAAVEAMGSGYSASSIKGGAQAVADNFNTAIQKACPELASSAKRLACMVGECAVESDAFRALAEYGGASAEPAAAPYYGRGYIQVTWKSNYAEFGAWMKSKGLVASAGEFVAEPDDVATLEMAAYTAVWYFSQKKWDGKTLMEWCDNSSSPWLDISRAINAGSPHVTFMPNAAQQRTNAINAALAKTGSVTVTPGAGSNSAVGKKMVDQEISMIGTLTYTEGSGRLGAFTTKSTDCSGLQWAVYKKIAGIDLMQGGAAWTGNMSQEGKTVAYWGSSSACNAVTASQLTGLLQLGDLVYYDWSRNGVTSSYDHVEMYCGVQTDRHGVSGPATIGHGGSPPLGPVINNMNSRLSICSRVLVKRYLK